MPCEHLGRATGMVGNGRPIMDPNVALAELRSQLTECLRVGFGEQRSEGWAEEALEALERMAALDEHLSRGGCLPNRWAR
jgi:hypothetical protein